MFLVLSFLWFIRETKAIFFWLYLWQLKEYHIGRFLDYFRTEKGKKSLFGKPILIKGILLFLLAVIQGIFSQFIILFVLILYVFESLKAFKNFFQKKLVKPVLTKKTIVLISTALLLELVVIFSLLQRIQNSTLFTVSILVFDILTPLIVSAVVLMFQPFAVLAKNQIIKKAKTKREQFRDLIVVGITGSYGKTSTKEFLATILSEKYKVLKTKEHQNSEIGIAQCILNDLKPDHEIFVVEMGAYNKGGIKLLCDMVKPKIGIITGINEQHLALFGTMENLLSAEGGQELIESLPEDGLVIFNGNNKFCQELYQKTKKPKTITYNTFSTIVENVLQKDIWAEDVRIEKEWIEFKVVSKGENSADFKVNLLGAQNVENILLATAVAKKLGMGLKEISRACEKIKQEQGAMKLIKGVNGLNIIDSTYSANPDGVIADLEYLKVWEGKKVIIMPCLIELGKSTLEVHHKIGEKIGEICVPVKEPSGSNGTPSGLAIITTKERFKEIKQGAKEKSMNPNNILFLEKPEEIFEKIKNFNKENDIIILEGRLTQSLLEMLTKKCP